MNPLHGDPQAEEDRRAAASVQVRPRIHFAGVIPLTPELVHPRHQRQRHALPGLSARGLGALERICWRLSYSRWRSRRLPPHQTTVNC